MRKRRMNVVRREERILPTPETLAKLRQPVWQTWEPELVAAAKEIEHAIALIAGSLQMRAADLGYVIRRTGDDDLTPAQRHLLFRYKAWVGAMQGRRSHVGYIVGILGCDEPVAFPGLLIDALRLYVKVNSRTLRMRRNAS
jgi:hypothetical protein